VTRLAVRVAQSDVFCVEGHTAASMRHRLAADLQQTGTQWGKLSDSAPPCGPPCNNCGMLVSTFTQRHHGTDLSAAAGDPEIVEGSGVQGVVALYRSNTRGRRIRMFYVHGVRHCSVLTDRRIGEL